MTSLISRNPQNVFAAAFGCYRTFILLKPTKELMTIVLKMWKRYKELTGNGGILFCF
jgi:hypothetical protein